eukprot:4817611-Pyramimonas_sp.AAC.1
MHERLIFALQSLIGHNVRVQLKNGSVYTGVFHTAPVDREVSVVLHMAYLMHESKDGKLPAADAKPFRARVFPSKAIVIPAKDLVQVIAEEATLREDQRVKTGDVEFDTDSNLSRDKTAGLVGRTLVAWCPEEGVTGVPGAPSDISMQLDDHRGRGGRGGNKSSGGHWDQFAVNSQMFGVHSSFDENIYTTSLDVGGGGISEAEVRQYARDLAWRGAWGFSRFAVSSTPF